MRGCGGGTGCRPHIGEADVTIDIEATSIAAAGNNQRRYSSGYCEMDLRKHTVCNITATYFAVLS